MVALPKGQRTMSEEVEREMLYNLACTVLLVNVQRVSSRVLKRLLEMENTVAPLCVVVEMS